MKTFSIGTRDERFVEVACVLCGNRAGREFLICSDYTFVRCSVCGLVYQNPQPVFKDLKLRYDEEYFQYELENDRNFFHLMKLGLEDIGFFDSPQAVFPGNEFLDIGCATGVLVKYMQDRGWSSVGVEICRSSAEYGIVERAVDIFIGTLEEAAFTEGRFSVIHFSHLIEHVPEPVAFLAEVKRILAPGGMIVVTTPNVDGFQAKLLRQRWRSAIADHLTLFSKKTLEAILERSGFRINRVVTWGGLAKGIVPPFVKRPVDYLAKKIGFGDVVLVQAGHSEN